MITTGAVLDIKISSWNCNGRLTQAINFIGQFVKSHHIIHLSETKHNNFTQFNIPTGFVPISKPGIRKGDFDRGGNILFVKAHIRKYIKKFRYFEWGIILYFEYSVLIFIYLVPEYSRYYRDESLSEFFNILKRIEQSGKDGFVIGDHNGRMGDFDFPGKIYDLNVDRSTNAQGILLASIYKSCEFYPINHLNIGYYTYTGNFTYVKSDKKSQIDYLFTNRHYKVKSFNIVEKSLESSDHKMLQCSLRLTLTLSTKALKLWAKDSNIVGKLEQQKVFRVNFNIDEHKLQREVQNIVIDYNNDLQSGIIIAENSITNFNGRLQKAMINCKEKGRTLKVTENWASSDSRTLWKHIDWSGKSTSTKSYDKPADDETYDFFTKLYAPKDEPLVEDFAIESNTYIPVTDDPITIKEVKDAFRQQKSGYNYTKRTLEPVKYILFDTVHVLFNIVFFAVVAATWAPTMLFTVAKKGNLTLPKNWRGIQMCEYLNAWYDRILSNRLKQWMSIDEFQTAYQKGKSCNTQIFTLRTITELGKKKKTPIFVTFIDLEKAFDRVRRPTMLQVLSNNGLGYNMLNAIKNLYSNTNVILHKIGNFRSTLGIRQGAVSSVYIFIIFINGLFKYLRDRFTVHNILGKIHNLIHADDTIIIDTNLTNMKLKIAATIEFFQRIKQNINSGKTKFMIIGNNSNKLKNDLLINNINISYSSKEKYLGHYVTDDNSMQKSIELDIEERGANVIIKYRNFVNNHPTTTLEICLKVFQACFCTTILSNCETWGPWIPRKVLTLYNLGLKLALGVRNNTPTALIFLETRQPYVYAMIRKRQYNFWLNLDKRPGTEMYNLINRASDIKYITHYKNLEKNYENVEQVFTTLNDKFYEDNWKKIIEANDTNTKLKTYHQIYNNCENLPKYSLSLNSKARKNQKIVSSYIMSSHDLETEKGRWSQIPKEERTCKQCNNDAAETLCHFLYRCSKFNHIRNHYMDYPTSENLAEFFNWKNYERILVELHSHRK